MIAGLSVKQEIRAFLTTAFRTQPVAILANTLVRRVKNVITIGLLLLSTGDNTGDTFGALVVRAQKRVVMAM